MSFLQSLVGNDAKQLFESNFYSSRILRLQYLPYFGQVCTFLTLVAVSFFISFLNANYTVLFKNVVILLCLQCCDFCIIHIQ